MRVPRVAKENVEVVKLVSQERINEVFVDLPVRQMHTETVELQRLARAPEPLFLEGIVEVMELVPQGDRNIRLSSLHQCFSPQKRRAGEQILEVPMQPLKEQSVEVLGSVSEDELLQRAREQTFDFDVLLSQEGGGRLPSRFNSVWLIRSSLFLCFEGFAECRGAVCPRSGDAEGWFVPGQGDEVGHTGAHQRMYR